jgi:Domain of unknown function (DUF1707)
MDSSRRLWPRADLRAGDTDRQAIVSELQRHYVEGRLTSEELGERVGQALSARTFGELATLLSDLPQLADLAVATREDSAPHEGWHGGAAWPSPALGLLIVLIGLVFMVTIFAMRGMHVGFFPWPLLIWGVFFFARPRRRRF